MYNLKLRHRPEGGWADHLLRSVVPRRSYCLCKVLRCVVPQGPGVELSALLSRSYVARSGDADVVDTVWWLL
eukprot:5401572-Amphidinium_carterae.1